MNSFIIVVGLGILRVTSPFLLCLILVLFVSLVGIWSHFVGRIWLIYSLIIIFLGGIIIVVIYTASVSNGFKFTVNLYGTSLASRLVGLWYSAALKIEGLPLRLQEGV